MEVLDCTAVYCDVDRVREFLCDSAVYDVEVVGYENPCRAYLWNAGKNPRGLIVDISEPEDIEFAKEKYNKKEWAL